MRTITGGRYMIEVKYDKEWIECRSYASLTGARIAARKFKKSFLDLRIIDSQDGAECPTNGEK